MTRPSDPPGAAQLRAVLQELTVLEDWAERVRDGGGGGGGSGGVGDTGGCGASEELVGPVLRVETMTRNGMHRMVAVRPAADHDEAQLAAVRSVVRALLDLTGHQEGFAWTEVVLTARGPRITAGGLGLSAAPPG
ncbi:hypothetical protein LN042_13635 [Kitasatospora sp. RB6PN24]|uniref:hypothetical protein n=1 Tax=Kitasatospora humi TaxID=2893891 RepID=UPI001E34574D|nr:hypothetical protein [Kitasatospora humi]MCC9308115.1 hypothetical protein [Kitasatospora humi]